MNTPVPDDVCWVVVIPAKPLATAKSRLSDAAGNRRPKLALAMLLDTIEATLAATRVLAVLVVTDDDTISAAASELGAIAIADAPNEGLNAAFRHGIETATAQYPSAGVALLAGDLPAMRASELEAALTVVASSPGMMVVADREGTGTTMLASRSAQRLRPAFGVGSLARHVALGAIALDDELRGLRSDVDDAAGLDAALRLGVGKRTAGAIKP